MVGGIARLVRERPYQEFTWGVECSGDGWLSRASTHADRRERLNLAGGWHAPWDGCIHQTVGSDWQEVDVGLVDQERAKSERLQPNGQLIRCRGALQCELAIHDITAVEDGCPPIFRNGEAR